MIGQNATGRNGANPGGSLFKRRNAGKTNRLQLIAANVDTVFIVTSANMDFNVARLERYLVLAGAAGITPVIVLTKADLAGEAGIAAARALCNRRRKSWRTGASRTRPR